MTNLSVKQGIPQGEINAYDHTNREMVSGAFPIYASNILTAGSITASSGMSNTSVVLTGSLLVADKFVPDSAGSPYGKGIVYNFTCAGATSGGQLVVVAAGLAKPAGANAAKVNGVAYGTTATHYTSGTTASIAVVVYGPAYLNVCTDIGDGDYAITGSVAHMVASGALTGKAFGTCVQAATSGTASLALVFVGM